MANGQSLGQGTNGTKDNHCSNWEKTQLLIPKHQNTSSK
jgi:hypothetical protein